MRAALISVLVFVLVVILIWIAAMIVYVAGSGLNWWVDRDGGVAMGFAFSIGPFFGLIGGLIAALITYVRLRRPPAGQ